MEEFRQIPLFYEQFYTYIAQENRLFSNEVIRTSDLTGEQLWLLDEGHCFRDQLERFCQLKAARASQLAYHLGSMETFMRMVESGKGITFIPELAVLQLNGTQKELVHPFAIPCPTRQIIMLTNRSFIRNTLFKYNRPRGNSGSAQRNALPESHSGTRIDFVYRPIKPFNRFLFYRRKMLYFCKQEKQRSAAPRHNQASLLLHSVCTIFAPVKQKPNLLKKYNYGTDYQLSTP